MGNALSLLIENTRNKTRKHARGGAKYTRRARKETEISNIFLSLSLYLRVNVWRGGPLRFYKSKLAIGRSGFFQPFPLARGAKRLPPAFNAPSLFRVHAKISHPSEFISMGITPRTSSPFPPLLSPSGQDLSSSRTIALRRCGRLPRLRRREITRKHSETSRDPGRPLTVVVAFHGAGNANALPLNFSSARAAQSRCVAAIYAGLHISHEPEKREVSR